MEHPEYLAIHSLHATPPDRPVVKRSIWWAVVAAFLIGVAWGHYGLMLP